MSPENLSGYSCRYNESGACTVSTPHCCTDVSPIIETPRRKAPSPSFRPPKVERQDHLQEEDPDSEEEDVNPPNTQCVGNKEEGYYAHVDKCCCGPHPPNYLHSR